jgi:hypothetical protein
VFRMQTRAIPRSWATGLAAVALLIAAAVPATVGAAGPVTPLCHGLPATIVGTPGQSAIRGTQGADVIVGFEVGVRIDGRGGDDTICAGAEAFPSAHPTIPPATPDQLTA